MNDRLCFQKYPENFAFQLFTIFPKFIFEICYFLQKYLFLKVSFVFPVYKQIFTT